MKDRIIIAGGSGMLGSRLTEFFNKRGHKVSILSRGESREISEFKEIVHWNPAKNEIPLDLFNRAEVLINLSGRAVNDKRWSESFKKELYKSRIEPTQKLVTILNTTNHTINTYVNASAIGYYGMDRGEEELVEESDPGNDFFADLCRDWETAALEAKRAVRCIIPRIGVVLDPDDGAFTQMKKPILLGAGSALGSGKQWVAWIHINDFVRGIAHLIENEDSEGIYNLCNPNPIQNRHLVGKIADSLNKPILLPTVPKFALKLVLGEMAKVVLGSLKVRPARLVKAKFAFNYTDIKEAVRQLNWG